MDHERFYFFFNWETGLQSTWYNGANLLGQFGYSFAFDAPTVWIAPLEEICSFHSMASFSTLRLAHLSPYTSICNPWCLTPFCPWIITEIV